MKKIYALLMAGVLTIAFAMPALAAPSPEAEVIETTAATASKISVPVSGAEVKALRDDVVAATIQYAEDQKFLSDMSVPTTAKLSAVMDLTYSGPIPAGGVQIPLVVNTAKAGDVVYVLHRRDDLPGMPWEKVGEGTLGGDLTVTCTFKSFSPVMIMVVDSSEAADIGVKAPKTGQY